MNIKHNTKQDLNEPKNDTNVCTDDEQVDCSLSLANSSGQTLCYSTKPAELEERIDDDSETCDTSYIDLPWVFLGMLSTHDIISAVCIRLQSFIWTHKTEYLLEMFQMIYSHAIKVPWSQMVTALVEDCQYSDVRKAQSNLTLSEAITELCSDIVQFGNDCQSENSAYQVLVSILICYDISVNQESDMPSILTHLGDVKNDSDS